MSSLEQLVTEWRDTREAILLVDWGHPTVDPARKALWTRLGHAESALMAYARQMTDPGPRSDAAIREAIDTGGGQTCDDGSTYWISGNGTMWVMTEHGVRKLGEPQKPGEPA